ncbi:MAG: cation:proton antiporter [Nitratireductor sp.]|nr:cation:proton antiporter [Nitratireductor sp.]
MEDAIQSTLEGTVGNTVDAIGDTAEAIGQAAEHLTDLGNIAAVASIAVIMGLIFVRLRQPPIVGYIAAGILLGPTGLGIVDQSESITILAELGVLLLLFLIGMEISIRAFVLVLAPAVLIAAGQLLAGFAVVSLFGWWLAWDWPQIVLLAFIVALSSTAVAIKVLDDIGELRTETGRITIGVLVAQDIAIVPMLIIAESFGSSGNSQPLWYTVALITGAVGVLGALIWYLNKPGKITLPFSRYLTGKPDLITLAMLAFCFAVAAVSSLFGLSAVYGAFIAGLIVANSTLRSEAIQLTFPVQSILVFIFFLSIGLLIDLDYIIENWVTVLVFVLATVAAKTILNILLVRRSGFSWDVALPSGLAMAQIGEFSFILASVGLGNRALDLDAYRLALSVIAVTLMISPLWMLAIRRFHAETTEHISTMREALSLAYASELQQLQAAGVAVSTARFRSRVYYRAARMAASRRRQRRKAELAAKREAAKAGPAEESASESLEKPAE